MDTNISNRILEKYPTYKSFFEPSQDTKKMALQSSQKFKSTITTYFTSSNMKYSVLLALIGALIYIVLTLPFTFSTVGKLLNKVGLQEIDKEMISSSLPVKNVVLHGTVFFIIAYFGLLSQKLA